MGSTELASEIDLSSYAISMQLMMSLSGDSDVDMPLKHYFADGIYVRSLTIPKGTRIIGKKHKYSCVNIMLSGDITVYADGDMERFKDSYIGIAPAGTQKAAIAHEETVWLCIHRIEKDEDIKDLKKIENDIVIDNESTDEILRNIRDHRGLS